MSSLHDLAATGLRALDPERAHDLTLRALAAGLGPRDDGLDDPALHLEMSGMQLSNCVGLAAGFDKNAWVPDAMLRAGFGFVECGSVTPLAQTGNPAPRVFRLAADRALINRLGFNNAGLEAIAARLQARTQTARTRAARSQAAQKQVGGARAGVVGANLGANKESTDRVADYLTGLRRLWGLADYFTVNISSPNTPGLRALQSSGALQDLCGRLAEARAALPGRTPVYLKIAPELSEKEIGEVVDIATRFKLNGLVVSNTTTERPASLTSTARGEAGGLSGAPLLAASTRALRLCHQAHDGKLALIAVGGISSGADAYAKVRAGACAVQLYTALVYQGPGLVRRIKRDLAARLRADGFVSIAEAQGVD